MFLRIWNVCRRTAATLLDAVLIGLLMVILGWLFLTFSTLCLLLLSSVTGLGALLGLVVLCILASNRLYPEYVQALRDDDEEYGWDDDEEEEEYENENNADEAVQSARGERAATGNFRDVSPP